MCGIAGVLSRGSIDPALLGRMAAAVAHRGPDDEGIWSDPAAGVGLVHRRLAIVDLSPAGHQPMHSADGRFVLTFNGEIYNHAELRAAIEGAGAAPKGGWRGRSDTEVLLQAIATWGLADALRRSAGMFALALWDKAERKLSLARDRFGEKPLYYGWAGRDLLFGSELRALRAHPRFDHSVEREAVEQLLRRTYIPAPLTIYRRTFKLPPASILTIGPEDLSPSDEPAATIAPYWSYRDVVRAGLDDPIEDEGEALAALEAALADAIAGQSVADVPVGAFLSGGIDSSTIVALYQKYAPAPVRTFTIGFEETGFNEAEHAKAVAAHFGTVHHEAYVTAAEARDVIPSLAAMYGEPFADPSQIPTHLVSRHARGEVTVALTGDGGDELFGGYNRHFVAPRLWREMQRVPAPLRAAACALLGQLPSGLWERAGSLARGGSSPHMGDKIRKLLRNGGSARSFDDFCAGLLDEWEGAPGVGAAIDMWVADDAPDAARLMYGDAVGYLPDDILCKVDRASMAVALETRLPYLDHRVAAVAARIPLAMKIDDSSGKRILRKLLFQHAPSRLFERPKAGFAVPIGDWIKGPLRGWAEDLLSPAAIASAGWLDVELVTRRWRDHLSGRRDWTVALWTVLMLQAWLREQRESAAAAA